MKKANIAYARNNLSKLIAQVREGDSILIMDRQKPVAKLEPITEDYSDMEHPASDLIRRGLVRAPEKRPDLDPLQENLPDSKGDILTLLLSEREEERL